MKWEMNWSAFSVVRSVDRWTIVGRQSGKVWSGGMMRLVDVFQLTFQSALK